MSEARYTPGPWTVEPFGGCQFKVSAHMLPRGGRTRTICRVASPRVYPNPELDAENEANAFLLGAGPDLVEALQAMLVAADRSGGLGNFDPELSAACDKASAALTKAGVQS